MRNIYQILVGFLGASSEVVEGAAAPAGWTFTPPPPAEQGKAAKWTGSGWVLVDYAEYLAAKAVSDADAVDALRKAKLAAANAECDRRINAIVATYPSAEVMTFPKQEAEALAFQANPATPTPLIDALVTSRAIPKGVLAGRIVSKANDFAAKSGAIIGYRQKLEDAINAAETHEALMAIHPLADWPQ